LIEEGAITMRNVQQRHTIALDPDAFGGMYTDGLFDICGEDDLISLSKAGTEPFLDWIGWTPSDVHTITQDFIAWVAPSEGAPRTGWVSDPCAARNSVQYGLCAYQIEGFGRIGRSTPPLDVTVNGLRLCERQTRKRLDGTIIRDEEEFRALLAVEVMMQDMSELAITGDNATAGQFSGFDTLVNTGYTDYKNRRCEAMDSIVIDWAANGCNNTNGDAVWNDGAGATPIPANMHIMLVLRQILAHIKFRIKHSSLNGRLTVGDMVIVGSSWSIECLIDCAVCWRMCGSNNCDQLVVYSEEGQKIRQTLLGGLFGDGQLVVDGMIIPLVKYDWGTGDNLYVLTKRVGPNELFYGQFNNMNLVPPKFPNFTVSDGGRFLHWDESDNTCVISSVEFQPRIVMPGPWAQAKIENFACDLPGSLPNPDPLNANFYNNIDNPAVVEG
jgi:hypothetical protein